MSEEYPARFGRINTFEGRNIGLEPTSRGDMCADLMRRWYERNRESWWNRHKPGIIGAGPDRSGVHADEFMLRLLGEAYRIGKLTDSGLYKEYD